MYKKGEKINAKVIKTQGVMERKRLKQQKMSFVNSIFNSSVSKLATHLCGQMTIMAIEGR